jgi:hypothetical protein
MSVSRNCVSRVGCQGLPADKIATNWCARKAGKRGERGVIDVGGPGIGTDNAGLDRGQGRVIGL